MAAFAAALTVARLGDEDTPALTTTRPGDGDIPVPTAPANPRSTPR